MDGYKDFSFYPQALSIHTKERLQSIDTAITLIRQALAELDEYQLKIEQTKEEIKTTLRDVNRLHYQILRSIT